MAPSLAYIDVYLSTIVHAHESLMLTVLLFIPSLLFSPKAIAAPIFLITKLFGYTYAIQYVVAICVALVATLQMKKQFNRPRPKPRPELTMKTMYFRNQETNKSMPSGDCTQAAVFCCYFIMQYNKGNEIYVIVGELLVYLIILLTLLNVMLGRVYFCCHYFSDCIAGIALGASTAMATLVLA